MTKYIFKRILLAVPLIAVISIICFTLIQFAPYDAIDTLRTPNMSERQLEELKREYRLDKPIYIQYIYWAKGILQGDLGNSLVTKSNIGESLKKRIPNTMILGIPAFIISFILAITLGLIAGNNRGKGIDKVIDGMTSLFISLPTFWFALMIMYIFGYWVKIFPVFGMYSPGGEESIGDLIRHLVLPCLTLVIGITPEMLRYVRSSTISELQEDYVMVQRAYGSSNLKILFHHVFKNILIPIVTLFGLLLPMLVTGSFITESIFSWPGVGPYFLEAIRGFDYPIIMAILLLSSTFVILGNLISDILYSVIDPRIRELRS